MKINTRPDLKFISREEQVSFSDSIDGHPLLLAEKTWCQVEEYLKTKNTVIVPIGSTEQHSPSGLLGIDFLSAEKIAHAVSSISKTICAPTLPIGMALHHMAFAGTMSFTPKTYELVIQEIILSLYQHGFKKFIILNGHGGNIAPVTSSFSTIKLSAPDSDLKLINWWTLKEVQDYESIHFGDKNGTHATCGEVSVTMYTHPNAYQNIKHPPEYNINKTSKPWPLSAIQFRNAYPLGNVGSNPLLATAEHGRKIFQIAVQSSLEVLASLQE